MADEALVEAIRKLLAASPFHRRGSSQEPGAPISPEWHLMEASMARYEQHPRASVT
jgi:hypothetical protein